MNASDSIETLDDIIDEETFSYSDEAVKRDQMIIHWIECPSFHKSEENLKQRIFQMIATSRCAAFLRLSALMPQEIYTNQSQRKAYLSPTALDIVPLYRTYPASLIQIITNAIPHFFTEPLKMADLVIEYFNSNPTYASLFGTVTFPALFYYFTTCEFTESAFVFVKNCLSITHNAFTSCLLAAFFDGFPRFTETLWMNFESKYQNKSVFNAFMESLSAAFRQLTQFHSSLIKQLYESDPEYLSKFFFSYYFQPRAHMKYFTAAGDHYLAVLLDLLKLLRYTSSNYGSPHQKILLKTILDAESQINQDFSYWDDVQLPVVYLLLSGVELNIFKELILKSDLIKFKNILENIKVSPEKLASLEPGFVQYIARNAVPNQNRPKHPILFDSHTVEAKENPEFERVWNQVSKLAIDEGQDVNEFIVNPRSQKGLAFVNSSIVQTDAFKKLMAMKIRSKASIAEKKFELFMAKLQTFKELDQIMDDIRRDSQMYMWKNAQEYVVNNCIAKGVMDTEAHKPIKSIRTAFIEMRYKESIPNYKFGNEFAELSYPVKNEMKSSAFSDLLNLVDTKENISQFNYHFALTLLNELPVESSDVIEMLKQFRIFSDKRRCKLATNEKIIKMISQNSFTLFLFNKIQRLRDLRVGNKIYEISEIISQFKEVYNHFYNDIDFTNFEEFFCDCFFFAGIDDFIISFIWFSKLASNFRDYIAAMDSDLIEDFISITKKIFSIVSETDPKLSAILNLSAIKIPLIG